MDWSKAKNILIIAFIVLNILLGYVLIVKDKEVDTTISSDFIEKSITLLNNKDIKLATEIPKINPELTALTVVYEDKKTEELNKNYFDNKGITFVKGEGLVEINNDSELITLVNNKLLIYESENNKIMFNNLTYKDAINLAMDFLKDRNYDTDDIKLSFMKKVEDVYYLEFSKVYGDTYLESAFTNIQIDNTGVIKMERMWLNVKEVSENSIFISTAPKSILGLLSMEEVYGKTITDIALCYYFNPGKHDYIEDPIEAKQGRAIPAWRIQFDDGYKIILDNY